MPAGPYAEPGGLGGSQVADPPVVEPGIGAAEDAWFVERVGPAAGFAGFRWVATGRLDSVPLEVGDIAAVALNADSLGFEASPEGLDTDSVFAGFHMIAGVPGFDLDFGHPGAGLR